MKEAILFVLAIGTMTGVLLNMDKQQKVNIYKVYYPVKQAIEYAVRKTHKK